jgi:GNAT superfamily N-acetyltransferase
VTTIREATPADLPGIQAMAAAFLASSRYRTLLTANAAQVADLVALVEAVGGLILVADVDGALCGLLALVVGPHPLTGELLAEELVWWVAPTARSARLGVRLLRAAEAWAVAQGVVWVLLVEPLPLEADSRYGRLGYTAIETRSVKRLVSRAEREEG